MALVLFGLFILFVFSAFCRNMNNYTKCNILKFPRSRERVVNPSEGSLLIPSARHEKLNLTRRDSSNDIILT